ncbi:MAG: hypothetical protein IJ048_05850 [Clostridia bacterium]|nr:hypothetical protein [Clostridia bacterium]
MTREEKLRLAKDSMALVRSHYQPMLTEYEAATGSRGLVAVWGRVGGRSNAVTHPTEHRAMASIEVEKHRQAMRDWYRCMEATFSRLQAKEGKSPNLLQHHRLLAQALQQYVFLKSDADMIALVLGAPKKLKRERVKAILWEVVKEVADEAERMGLFQEEEKDCQAGG